MGMFGANPKGWLLTLGLLDQKLNPNPHNMNLSIQVNQKGQINDLKMTAIDHAKME